MIHPRLPSLHKIHVHLPRLHHLHGPHSHTAYIAVLVLGVDEQVAVVARQHVLVQVRAFPGAAAGDALVQVVDEVDWALEGQAILVGEGADHGRGAQTQVVDLLQSVLAL